MNEEAVVFTKDGKIATITLNRPKAMNSMNAELVDELIAALNKAGKDDECKVIVLTGNGRAFSAGGDLFYLESLNNQMEARTFVEKVGSLVSGIINMKKPVIAMVNGVAAGAGFNLALACDIIFCAESARFAQSFAKVGLVPDCGGMYLLPRIIGRHKAKELMFTADIIKAEAALKMGLVNRIMPDENLKQETYVFAQKLADSAPLALAFIKRMVNKMDTLDLESTLSCEADLQSICMQTEDYKEGVQAFKEKRQPVFHGK